MLFGSGLRAPAAPGSIIAVYAQTASGSFLGVTLSVLGAAAVSFLVASLLLKTDRAADEPDLAAATAEMEALKGKKSSVAAALVGTAAQSRADHQHRLRLRRRHGILGDGSLGAAQEDPEGGVRRCQGGQPGHLQPDRHLRSRGHAPGSDRPCPPEDTVGGPCLGRRLHEQPRYDEIVELLGQTNGGASPTACPPVPSRRRRRSRRRTSDDVLALDSIVLDGTATQQ